MRHYKSRPSSTDHFPSLPIRSFSIAIAALLVTASSAPAQDPGPSAESNTSELDGRRGGGLCDSGCACIVRATSLREWPMIQVVEGSQDRCLQPLGHLSAVQTRPRETSPTGQYPGIRRSIGIGGSRINVFWNAAIYSKATGSNRYTATHRASSYRGSTTTRCCSSRDAPPGGQDARLQRELDRARLQQELDRASVAISPN